MPFLASSEYLWPASKGLSQCLEVGSAPYSRSLGRDLRLAGQIELEAQAQAVALQDRSQEQVEQEQEQGRYSENQQMVSARRPSVPLLL